MLLLFLFLIVICVSFLLLYKFVFALSSSPSDKWSLLDAIPGEPKPQPTKPSSILEENDSESKTTKTSNNSSSKGSSMVSESEVEGAEAARGNLGDVCRAKSITRYLQMLHDKHGPIATFWWGDSRVVSLADADMWAEASGLSDRPSSLYVEYEAIFGMHSFFFSNGPDWIARKREYVDLAFGHFSVRASILAISSLTQQLINQWTDKIKAESLLASITIPPVMHQLVTHTCLWTTIGSSLVLNGGETLTSVISALETIYTELERRVQHIDSNIDTLSEQGREAMHLLHTCIQNAVDEKKTNMSALIQGSDEENNVQKRAENFAEKQSLLDYMLLSEETPESIMRDDVITFLLQGILPMRNLLTWLLYYIASNPSIQKQAKKEIKSALGDRLFPSLEDIPKLPYITRVIQETLRITQLVSWTARYSCPSDMLIGDYGIPEGTPLIFAVGRVMMDPKYWSKPEEFNPDRFLDFKASSSTPLLAFSPFGFSGKRLCPAARYAYAEAFTVVCGILQSFNLSVAKHQPKPVAEYGLSTGPRADFDLEFTLA